MPDAERSFERIEDADLERLAFLAKKDHEDFFARHPRWRDLYAGRIVCVALCQGAALHFVDGRNGVKDFDVWTFFAEHPAGRLRADRRVASVDFGPSKFGHHPGEAGYIGRRIDFLMRSLRCQPDADPAKAIREYLSSGTTGSARALARKAVVLIEPNRLRGRVVWPFQ